MADVDYTEPEPESTEGMVELDDRKFSADDVIYSDPFKDPVYQAKINQAMQSPSAPADAAAPQSPTFDADSVTYSAGRRRKRSYTGDDSGSEDYIGSRRRH